jgi:hypothetical protein
MLGFYAEQGGYIYLVFDTRPGETLDGNWTLRIDEPKATRTQQVFVGEGPRKQSQRTCCYEEASAWRAQQ